MYVTVIQCPQHAVAHQRYTTSNNCEIFTVYPFFMKLWDLEDKIL